MLMRSVREIRRGAILAKKRFDLLKYNFKFKAQRGGFYDIQHDIEGLRSHKQMNILDLKSKREMYLLDPLSDATEYGGLSETQLLHNEEEGYLRLKAKFVKEKQGFQLENTTMFCGFQNNYLIKKEFEYFNGIRVTMKPPIYPCKVGLHIQITMGNEHELFVVSFREFKLDLINLGTHR